MLRAFLFVLFLAFVSIGYSQSNVIEGSQKQNYFNAEISDDLSDYEVFSIDYKSLNIALKNRRGVTPITLKLGTKYNWNIELIPSEIISPRTKVTVSSENGIEDWELPADLMTFKGWSPTSDKVSLTIYRSMINGFVQIGENTFFIEPLTDYDKDATEGEYIVYNANDVKELPGVSCGVVDMEDQFERLEEEANAERSVACKEVEIGMAGDWLLTQEKGSVGNVISHLTAIMNNVQTNYDDEFNDELQYFVIEFWISSCSTCDPWTSSTSAGALLSSFASWAPSGFCCPHDVGQLWTNRNFNGSTVGVAYLSSICTSQRYNTCQDYTGNSARLRVLSAHELGHNWSASHDASTTDNIMYPSVTTSNNWTSQSRNQINNHISSRWCLGSCNPSFPPPSANFTGTPQIICEGDYVSFIDQSTGQVDSWSWFFEGGDPMFSTDQDPIVFYPVPGVYNVELEVCNIGGCDTKTSNSFITVEGIPQPFFTYVNNDLLAIFTNQSSGNGSLLWDFGDGNFSTEPNPYHLYPEDGEYLVTLTITNICGSFTYEELVVIVTSPVANFSASPMDGCTPLEVFFENLSSDNSVSFEWTFEGGTPDYSTEEEPIVIYNDPGFFDVTLVAKNAAGQDELIFEDFITVEAEPQADFDHETDSLTVTFENLSLYGDIFEWSFGDGEASSEENPVHIYAEDGIYLVTLSVENDCGDDIIEIEIIVISPPSAGFAANPSEGCAELEVTFENLSSANSEEWFWSMPGATPDTSTAENPTVIYTDSGTYSVTLIATNPAGSDTITYDDIIVVLPLPTAGFSTDVNDFTKVDFLNNTQNGTTYFWDFDDEGATSTDENPSYDFGEDGVYNVMLIATNDCGDDTTFQEVVIVTPPAAGFSSSVRVGCAELEVEFYDESSPNTTEWSWEFEGGSPTTSTEQNPIVTYDTPGVYGVSLTAKNSAGENTIEITTYVTVLEAAFADFDHAIQFNTVAFENLSKNAQNYFWDFGDGQNSTESDPVHMYTKFGTYTVMLVSSNGGCSDTTYQQVDVEGNINSTPGDKWPCDLFLELDCGNLGPINPLIIRDENSQRVLGYFATYPNPSAGNFTVQINMQTTDQIANLAIFNLQGLKVFEDKVGLHNGFIKHQVQLDALPGTYLVVAQVGQKRVVRKVIIETP